MEDNKDYRDYEISDEEYRHVVISAIICFVAGLVFSAIFGMY